MKKRLFIAMRAALMVSLTTTNIYFISIKMYYMCIIISAAISMMWTLNVKDLAISNWYDRISYVIGGIIGTSIALYLIPELLTK